MSRFFNGLVMMVAEIAIGIFWCTVMIAGAVAMWFLFYALVTGFMR